MADSGNSKDVDAKAKMLEALARKQGGKVMALIPTPRDLRKLLAKQVQTHKMFRRKSGSA